MREIKEKEKHNRKQGKVKENKRWWKRMEHKSERGRWKGDLWAELNAYFILTPDVPYRKQKWDEAKKQTRRSQKTPNKN
jgi:hypothetical protein